MPVRIDRVAWRLVHRAVADLSRESAGHQSGRCEPLAVAKDTDERVAAMSIGPVLVAGVSAHPVPGQPQRPVGGDGDRRRIVDGGVSGGLYLLENSRCSCT